jgi:type I restriction enzyme, S subunit
MDFVFARTGGAGMFGMIEVDCGPLAYASYLIRFRFDNSVDAHFLRYFFLSQAFQTALTQNIHGGVNQNVHAEDIKEQFVVIPSRPEQTSIVTFLDRETSKIDALVEEQRRLIELLKEKRQSVISHAVTKGLDPNASMKHSGVEGLGEVPEHWDVSRVKYHCTIKGRIGFRGYTTADQVDEGNGALVLGATHITSVGEINVDEPVFLSWEKYYESPEIMVSPTNILVVQRGSTCGKVGFVAVDHGPSTINHQPKPCLAQGLHLFAATHVLLSVEHSRSRII